MSGEAATDWRRAVGRCLAGAGIVCVAACGFASLLWWKLPQWAPAFVVHHSRWIEPLLRADTDGDLSEERDARIADQLGDAFAARLAPYLRSGDARVRHTAAWLLADRIELAGAFDSLLTAGDEGCAEARRMIELIADGRLQGDDPSTAGLRERASAAVERYRGASSFPRRQHP